MMEGGWLDLALMYNGLLSDFFEQVVFSGCEI